MLKPFGNRVVVKADKPENTTKSGLYIPANAATDNAITGLVLAVGQGDGEHVPESNIGDHVIFNKYDATLVTVNDESVYVIPDNNIIASF